MKKKLVKPLCLSHTHRNVNNFKCLQSPYGSYFNNLKSLVHLHRITSPKDVQSQFEKENFPLKPSLSLSTFSSKTINNERHSSNRLAIVNKSKPKKENTKFLLISKSSINCKKSKPKIAHKKIKISTNSIITHVNNVNNTKNEFRLQNIKAKLDLDGYKINKMINRNEDELFIKYYNRILKIYNNNK